MQNLPNSSLTVGMSDESFKTKYKIIVIVGPTASGKSELAVKLAKKINGEIISADSRQIYRGLDIGTGKVRGKWTKYEKFTRSRKFFIYRGIPHYCIDFVSPKRIFTAAEFKKCAINAIKEISNRGKIPIVAGGTGFWINALVYDMPLPEVRPNYKLRRRLEKKNREELLKILQKLDPERAKTIEQKNPRRLIRAIEVAQAIGRVPKLNVAKYQNAGGRSESGQIINITKNLPYKAIWIGLHPPQKILKKRMCRRVKLMLKSGLIRETKKLIRDGIPKKRILEFGFEYRAALDYVDKKISRKELLERLVHGSLEYARRQLAWFKKNKDIKWVSGLKGDSGLQGIIYAGPQRTPGFSPKGKRFAVAA